MTMQVLIVDDEEAARVRLQYFLNTQSDIFEVQECANGRVAVERILATEPDLVFLDVEMPELDGFEVIRRVGPRRMPMTVLVTAHERHAVQAFDEQVVDYLLKPFDQQRFERAMARVRQRLVTKYPDPVARKLDRILEQLAAEPDYLENLVIRTGQRIHVLPAGEIDRLTAESNYIRIFSGTQSYVLRETLGSLAARLRPKHFVRIHRSHVVRISHIAHLEPVFKGEYLVVLRDGTKLNSSRTYRDDLERALGVSG